MKKFWLYLIAIIPLILLSCVGYYLLLRYATIGSKSIENLNNLLIEESDFPTGWKFEYKMPIYGDFALGEENINIAFSKKPELGFAHQYVYRFKNTLITNRSYGFLRNNLVLVDKNQGNFSEYESVNADKWYLACTVSEVNDVMCDYLAKFDNFIIYFGISAKDNQLTPDQFDQLLQTIENRVLIALEK